MKDVKETKEGWNKETTELIEIAREVVQVARKIRAEKPPAPITKEETPYEKVPTLTVNFGKRPKKL